MRARSLIAKFKPVTTLRPVRHVVLATLASLVLLALFGPERVRAEWTIVGAHVLDNRAVREALALPDTAYTPADEAAAAGRLGERYAAAGYYDAVFTFTGDTVRVDEGERQPIRSLDLQGQTYWTRGEILREWRTREGDVLRPTVFEQDLDRTVSLYADEGYPFARIVMHGVTRSPEGGINLALRVLEGPPIRLRDLSIEGDARTKPAVVARLSGLTFGSVYKQSAVDESRERLLRSGLYRFVGAPETRVDWTTKEATIVYDLTAARASRVEGVFGVAPDPDGGSALITGFFRVDLRNIAGTARQGRLYWERTGAESRAVEVAYREPWLFGSRFGVGAEIYQTIRDSTYAKEELSGTLDFALTHRVRASFTLGVGNLTPRREESLIPRSNRRWGRVGVVYDSRDDLLNPTRGLHFRFEPEYAERTLDAEPARGIAGDEIKQSTMDATLALFRPVSGSMVLAWEGNILARYDNGPVVAAYDQFFLGGTRTLRGYEEDRFLGSRLAWLRTELRYRFGPLSRAFLFLDSGYVYSEKDEGDTSFWRQGYGAGVRLPSGIGVIGIDFGLGRGDALADGKLHVIASGEF